MEVTLLDPAEEDYRRAPEAAEVAALCRRLLADGPEARSAREIGSGSFNHTFIVECTDGRRSVLRISPICEDPALFSHEIHLLRREIELGRGLTPLLGSLLPAVLATDFSGEVSPRDAVLNGIIEGENWETAGPSLTADENDALWDELGRLVRRIHAVRGSRFGWPEIKGGMGHASWSGFVLHAARGLLLDHGSAGVSDEEAREWLKAVEDGRRLLEEIREPRLTHGDLRPRNVLIRRDGGPAHIVGLLGHAFGFWGDPLCEPAFQQLEFPAPFWQVYGQRPTGPGADFRRLTYLGLVLGVEVLERCRLRQEAARARRRLVETTQHMRQIIVACGL